MTDRLAIKRLTQTDLRFFDWHHRDRPQGKQKAIGLNKRPFIKVFYPHLSSHGDRFILDLNMYGPGLAAEHTEVRNVILQDKNWRLNGKTIENPADAPTRYNVLRADDFAIMDFYGDPVPEGVRVVFVAANEPEDGALHAVIDPLVGRRRSNSMVTFDRERLAALVREAGVVPAHPVNELLFQEELEEAAAGNDAAVERILRRRSGRRVSRKQLQRAKESADRNGRDGEKLVNSYLDGLKQAGTIKDFVWASDENALSPYDFKLTQSDDVVCNIDVKSTSGDFESPIFVSLSELRVMADHARPYRIYRVSNLVDDVGILRVSEPLSDLASRVFANLANVPEGVTVNNLSIKSELLGLGNAIHLTGAVEEQEDDVEEEGVEDDSD